MIFELDNLDPADWFIPVHEEDVGDDVDQIENIAEDQLEGPVAVAPVVIYNKYLQIYQLEGPVAVALVKIYYKYSVYSWGGGGDVGW